MLMSDNEEMCVDGGGGNGRLELTISMDDTGPMLLTYMPTSMTVGFTARARKRKKNEGWWLHVL